MFDLYILDKEKNPIPASTEEYARWSASPDYIQRVGYAESHTHKVSTVFLGLNHNFKESDKPILFETMVFPLDSLSDEICERYSSWDEAVEGHKRISEEWQAKEASINHPVYEWLNEERT